MAEPKLNLGKGFGKDLSPKKHKHSVFGILLIIFGVYFLVQNYIDFLSDSKIYNGAAIALIIIGIIVFFRRRKNG